MFFPPPAAATRPMTAPAPTNTNRFVPAPPIRSPTFVAVTLLTRGLAVSLITMLPFALIVNVRSFVTAEKSSVSLPVSDPVTV